MRYMGSKRRIAKHILPIMVWDRKPGQFWVEPFVGGANMIDKVDGNRLGADINEYLITLFHGLQNGFVPPDFVSEEFFKWTKNNRTVCPLTAFIGFGCSYAGMWFAGYARNVKKDAPNAELLNRTTKSFCKHSKNGIMRQLPNLLEVGFLHCSYDELYVPPNSKIYCDPPYEGTTGYKDGFSHPEFWQWCRVKANEGHDIYISEYNAPDDFICLWSGELTNGVSGKKETEKLFTYVPGALR